MRVYRSIARIVLLTGYIVAAFFLGHLDSSAQTAMEDMPGMEHAASPSPPPVLEPAESPAPESAAPTIEQGMEGMPGMEHPNAGEKGNGKTPTAKDLIGTQGMEDMPGMEAASKSQKKEMSDMPGMNSPGASEKSEMEAMPGMPAVSSRVQRMSAPGILLLRQPQKWNPPPGNDRSGELLTMEELRRHMAPLPPPIEDSHLQYYPLFELLEYRFNSAGPDTFVWDFNGWFGGDHNRLWVKSGGRQALSKGNRGEGDLQLLYGKLIAPFWDFQIGARARHNFGDGGSENPRTYAVIGFQGLAPGNFEIEPSLFISDRGEVSSELTVTADLYLTQRLILQPRFQGEFTIQGDPRFETGEGGMETDLGVRLRYAITREIQPYIGVSWLRSYGANARIARESGETSDTIGLVAGLQLWW